MNQDFYGLDRNIYRGLFPLLFLALCSTSFLATMGGCSGQRTRPRDGDADIADASDADYDDDGDSSGDADSDTPEPLPPSTCGNGLIDEGEECDDGNRLNGDDCDWRCREGIGEPQPEPDEAVPLFDVDGPPEIVVGVPMSTPDEHRLPLQWSESDFATAFYIGMNLPGEENEIAFRRYDEVGEMVESGWTYPVSDIGASYQCDLVWNGEHFGLIYIDDFTTEESGNEIYFLLLDIEGKPVGERVRVVEATGQFVTAPDAAWVEDRFVLVWSIISSETSSEIGCRGRRNFQWKPVWAREIGPRGETEGYIGPTLLSETAHESSFPTIAGGPEGYAVLVTNETGSSDVSCTSEVLQLNRDLDVVGSSHALSPSWGGEILATEDGFLAVWTRGDTTFPEEIELCSGRFSASGVLHAAPACSAPLPYEIERPSYARAAIGAEGFGVIVAFTADHDVEFPRSSAAVLAFQRLDAAGTPTGSLIEAVYRNQGISPIVRYAIDYGADIFGVLFQTQDYSTGRGFQFQRFVERE